MLNTSSDPYLLLAAGIGFFALVLTAVLILVIVFLRLRLRKNLRREAALVDLWRPLLLEALSDDSIPVFPRLDARDQIFFLKLWSYLQESLRGAANARLNELARQLHCDVAARKFLKTGNRAERLLAILALGHLRDRMSWEELALQARTTDRQASIYAARALIKIDPVAGTKWLLPLLLERHDWDLSQIADFLGEAKPVLSLQLMKNIFKIDPQQWSRALQLAHALQLELPISFIHFVLENSRSTATLVAALRLASGVELLTAVRGYLRHPEGLVRVEAARFLSLFGDASDIAPLRQLLDDPQWWVRHQAAQSLADLPFFGRGQLQALRDTTGEGVALDMLNHVLAEHHGATT